MNLDGARNVKADIFEEAFGFQQLTSAFSAGDQPAFVPKPDSEAYEAMLQARRERRRDPRDLIALAVLDTSGHNRNPDGLSLGILIQQKRLMDHPIVTRALRAARGEATVIFTGPVRSLAALNAGRCRPLPIGASIGHERVTAGTLGCFAPKRLGGGLGMLSNNHVLANCNRCRVGDRIIQPGPLDGGRRNDVHDHVAILDKWEPISFQPGTVNLVDCAFAYIVDGIGCTPQTVTDPASQECWPVGIFDDLVYGGMRAKKVGRTTGITKGSVQATEIDNLQVGFSFGNTPLAARFDKQISFLRRESPFARAGDSGSLIVSEDNQPIALLFAGSERSAGNGPGITFANPIGTVLDVLDVDIFTGA